jgi:hypothetical protein
MATEHDEEAAPATESPIEVPSLSHAAEQGSPGNVPAGASESGSVVLREYKSGKLVQEKLVSSAVLESMLHVSHSAIKRMEKNKALQRPGETIYKGHESYDLMVALQQGIRHSIGSVTSARMPPALSENAMQQAVSAPFHRLNSPLSYSFAPLIYQLSRVCGRIISSIAYWGSLRAGCCCVGRSRWISHGVVATRLRHTPQTIFHGRITPHWHFESCARCSRLTQATTCSPSVVRADGPLITLPSSSLRIVFTMKRSSCER